MRRGLLLAVAWTAVVVWLTWPLSAHLTTHLPDTKIACRFDALLAAWAGAHETRALTTAPTTLLDAPIFHPSRRTLLYCEAGYGALPLFAPVFLATANPALALNLTFILGLALTAAMLHLVVGRWTGSELGGGLAAWAFLTTRWTVWEFAPTAPNYAVLFYLPLVMGLAATPAASLGQALRLVPLIVLQSLTSFVYLTVATFAPLGLLALARLARRATRAAGLRLLAALALAGVVLLPLLLAVASVRRDNPRLEWQTLWVAIWPKVAQPMSELPWGTFRDPLSPLALPLVAFGLIGLGALSLALRGRGARPFVGPWVHGLLWTVTGLLLSLTPAARWDGEVVLLPQVALAQWLPALTALRVPGRIGIAGLMGLALLVGAAFAECARRIGVLIGPSRLAAPVCALLALLAGVAMHVENASGRRDGAGPRPPLPAVYPLQPAPTLAPALAASLAAGTGPVLELPLRGRGVDPLQHAPAMYRAIGHRRPLLNGYCGYWTKGFRGRMALAMLLPDAERLATLRDRTGLTTILLHAADLEPDELAEWQPAIAGRRPDLQLVARDGPDLLFAVRAP